MHNGQNGLGVKSFDPPLVKKTNFRRFSWKLVKFELQLPHSLLFIFWANSSSAPNSNPLLSFAPNF